MDRSLVQLFLDAFNRRFEEFEARMDRCFSPSMGEQRDAAEDHHVGALQQHDVQERCVCAPTTGEAVSIDEHSPDPAASRTKFDTSDASAVFPDENPIRLDRANVTLLVASGALEEQDTAAHFAMESTFTAPVAPQVAGHFGSLVAHAEQEKHAVVVPAEGLGASGHVCIGVHLEPCGLPLRHTVHTEQLLVANSATAGQSELHATAISYSLAAPDDLDLLCCARLGPVKCVLRDTPLGGYDGSLDDDPESDVAYFDAPLDRTVGCVGRAPAAAAALRADAVGAAGGGMLARVVAAGSVQATCSTICPAGDRSFADVPMGALLAEEMLRWNSDNYGLAPVSYSAALEPCNLSTYTVAMHREAGAAYAALVPVVAVVVFANGGEPGFHHYIIDDTSAIPADAFARFMTDVLAPHGEASSLLLLRGHGPASILNDAAAIA